MWVRIVPPSQDLIREFVPSKAPDMSEVVIKQTLVSVSFGVDLNLILCSHLLASCSYLSRSAFFLQKDPAGGFLGNLTL